MTIHCSKLRWDEVIFSHIDEDTGAQTHYAISTMIAWIKSHWAEVEKVTVPIETAAAEMIRQYRGIEQHRLNPLLTVENPDPVIFVTMADDTHLLVDGSHRYVAMYAQRKPHLRAFVLTWEQAQQFIITGIPVMPREVVVGGYSGL